MRAAAAGEGSGRAASSPPASGKLQSPQGPSGAQPVVAAANMNQDAKKPDFDPYHKWLGIPPEEQPPTHYRLLGLQAFESDPEVILAAVMQRSAHLKTYQLGQHSALTQKLLNEVSAAKVCLLDPQRKAAYNARLRKELEAKERRPARKPFPGQTACRAFARSYARRPLPAASPATPTPAAPAESAAESGLAELFNQIEASAGPSHPQAKQRTPLARVPRAARWERGRG